MHSILLPIFLLMIANTGAIDICNENNGNPRIKVALRINNYTILISNNKKVYRIENLRFDGKEFKFGNIKDLTHFWTQKGEDMYAFPMNYEKKSPKSEVRIIRIRKETNEGIEQLFSYQTLYSQDLEKNESTDRISLLIHKHRPEPENTELYDPITLITLFSKFPSDSIMENLKTILAFPLNEEKLPNQTPTERQQKEGKTTTIFKRHIMIGKRIKYESPGSSGDYSKDTEIDWQHDIQSGKCFQHPIIVNASFPITDYTFANNSYHFEIIEFSGDLYFLKRVILNKTGVQNDLQLIKVGTIGSIFGCRTSVTVPPLTESKWTTIMWNISDSSEPKHIRKSLVFTVMFWTSNTALIVVFLLFVFMIYAIFYRSFDK